MEMDEEIDYEALPSSAPLTHQLAAGAFAGIMEHSIMFPIDAIKTRMQAISATVGSSNAAPKLPSNIMQQIARISTTEGSMALWKGVQSVILGAGPAHAVYFATYEMCKGYLIDPQDFQTHQPLKTAASGVAATIAADMLMNPFDTIKQRMQLRTFSNDRMWAVASRIYRNEGLAAFFYSYPTTIAMNIPFAAFNFVIYESSTKLMNPNNSYNPLIHCLCGGLSGATCAAITTPLDCIKTVLQIRGSESVVHPLFRSADTFSKAASAIFKIYGWSGFWRGLKPRIISNMPATAISWTAYECAKHFLFR
ncbi:Mitochondrial RNA-splicing protein MRS4 [Lachancea thermotolerans]|uniref:KLTH0F05786p n=1 Tax=Lachancea thermotolerans (strain ATCC 56472 / CBS 6340 / NRRL Y-8284) TaxID=559295 RepID=C5DKL9_LACTC|nr:KLTH0F05786p [Lachancea thermotolerans CBS 6340]CAR24020.1 KLTH0F05786p [Lachancea thermotolerans CBS 6340]